MNSKIIFAAALCLAFFIACKKKDEVTSPPANNTASNANSFTAKVNGVNWSACSNCYSSTGSMGYYTLTGTVTFGNFASNAMLLYFPDTVGIFSLGGFGPYGASYKDSSGTLYNAVSGQLHIMQMDTTSAGVKKFIGTFNFQTDSSGGKAYTITNGSVNYTK